MKVMGDGDGERLFQLFVDLNIKTGALQKNVVKAWFDTDDKTIKNFLCWMFKVLSPENCLTLSEILAYEKIEPYKGQNYELEKKKLENKYPHLFELESNSEDVEHMENEVEWLQSELEQLDECLELNEDVSTSLSMEISSLNTKCSKNSVQKNKRQEDCNESAHELVGLNTELHKKITCCSNYIKSELYYPSRFNLEIYETNLNKIKDFIEKFIESLLDRSENFHDNSETKLSIIRDRLIQSEHKLIARKMDGVELTATLNFLQKCDITSVSFASYQMGATTESKTEQKNSMLSELKSIAIRQVDDLVNKPKIQIIERKLENYRLKSEYLDKLTDGITNMVAYYILLNTLHIYKQEHITTIQDLFKKIKHHISINLRNCLLRTEIITKILAESEELNKKPIEEANKFVKEYGRLIMGENKHNLNDIIREVSNLHGEIDNWETNFYVEDIDEHFLSSRDLYKHVYRFGQSLRNDATSSVQFMPTDLRVVIASLDRMIKEDSSAIRLGLQQLAEMKHKLSSDKWLREGRLLWMNFICNPEYMRNIIEQIRHECEKHRNASMFK